MVSSRIVKEEKACSEREAALILLTVIVIGPAACGSSRRTLGCASCASGTIGAESA